MESEETKREMEIQEFNAGPTNGTLNDKRRLAWIYEELLNVKDLLQARHDPDVGRTNASSNDTRRTTEEKLPSKES